MPQEITKEQKNFLYHTIYIIIALVSMMPVACNYIMEGGILADLIAQSGFTNPVPAWQLFQLIIQLSTLLSSVLLFKRILGSAAASSPVLTGTALYVLCPYRICLCYDWANLPLAAAFALLPLFLWAVLGLALSPENKLANLFAAGLSGALSTVLFVFCYTKGILGNSAYVIGEFFSSYAYSQTHPGMGIALMLSLLTGSWFLFVKNVKSRVTCKFFILSGALSLFLSLFNLYQTSMLFFGSAQLFLCIPAAFAIQDCRREQHKFLSVVIPVIILISCVGLAVYQCNTLTYTRYPVIGM